MQQLHDAFMGSAGHRANMLNASYNRVGIGVVLSGGKIWVTVRFLAGPAIAGSTGLGPPPPPPGVPTVLTGDFDGDGNDDFLTYGPGSQADELWFGRDDRSLARTSMAVNGQYRPIAGDFDADGMTEILWYVPGSTADPLWDWNGSGWSATTPPGERDLRALRRRLRRRRRATTSSGTARARPPTPAGTARPAAGSRRPP